MAFTFPTFDETHAFLLAAFKRLFPDRAVTPINVFGKLMAWVAGVATDLHAGSRSIVRDVMPDTTEGAMLDRWLYILAPGGRRERKDATAARKADALRVAGTPGSTVPVDAELRDPATGLRYKITENDVVAAGGYVDVSVAAISVGSATRLPRGTVLEFVSPPAGLNTVAELQLALDEDGADREQDPAARARMLAALADPPRGGSPGDFVGWAQAVEGIPLAYCYPGRAGLGTVDVVAFHAGTGGARLLTALERDELLAELRTKTPAQLSQQAGALRVLDVAPEDLDVEIAIESDRWDWDDSTPPVVTAWNPTTRVLGLSTRPASLVAGARLAVVPASGVAGVGEPLVVEALSGLTDVILEAAPSNTPAASDLVYAGGPLVAPIRDALLAHLSGQIVYAGNGLPIPAATAEASGESPSRLRILAEPLGPENRGRLYGEWSGTAVRSTFSRIATYAAGVVDCDVISPPVDVDPAVYVVPNDDQVGMLFPRRMLIRRRH